MAALFSGFQAQANDSALNDAQAKDPYELERDFEWTLYADLGVTSASALFIDPAQNDVIDFLSLSILIDIYYHRFFLEQNNQFRRANMPSTLGYRLYRERNLQIDILIGQSYLNELSEQQGNTFNDTPSDELAGIRTREADFSQGIRFSMIHEDRAWWIDLAGDLIADIHDGWLIDAYHSWLYPVKNWDIQFGLGATYFSDSMVDYYAGVQAEEATALRPVYKAGEGYRTTAEVSAQYPINEDWLFRAGLVLTRYSSAFEDSPLYRTNVQTTVGMSVAYVW